MDENHNPKNISSIDGQLPLRVYKKRWFMLLIYFIIFPISTMQWTQFTLIANIVVDYYNVSYEAVNWTYLITSINAIVFAFPCCYLVDKFGIKNGALFAIGGATAGAWIKFYSISPDKFWLVLVGQAVLSVPQMCLVGIGPKLAADWFKAGEVAMANSIGIIGLQLGIALGFLLPPLLVKKETVEDDLYTSALGLAVICTIAFVLVFLFLKDKPPKPPSQASLKKYNKIHYIKSVKNLMKNVPYLLVVLVGGSNVAILCLIQSLLNQIVLKYHPAGEEDAGLMGLLMMVFCITGCFICGGVLMKFKTYRLCYCISTLFMSVALVMFVNTLQLNIIFPFVGICLYGYVYRLQCIFVCP
ncbi:hypothetical protein FQR65_LT11023 [Abscondita terminalis]|nr:hypothetical protein FQR65_LT11023 [Abscondita terminalis]